VVAVAGGEPYSLAQLDFGKVVFARHPLGAVVAQGKPLLLSTVAISSQPVSYRWRRNGGEVPEATNASLYLPATQIADEGEYVVIASNSLGAVTSRVATVVVTDRPPVIVTQPSSAAMTDTTPLLLSVQAAGSATLKFQWRKDEQAIPGETNTTFSLLTPRRTNSGSYSVSVTNTFGSVISADAKVRVVVPVQIGKPRISADGGVLISAADRDGAPLGPNDTPFFSIAMELGCHGVLMNTAIAGARDPILMASAMRKAVEAGREAFLAGRIPRKRFASASSPIDGLVG
jgi:hypothetical protein